MADELVAGKVDPRGAKFISIFGKKKSGKSFLARRFFDTYPYDRLVLDPHHEIDVDLLPNGQRDPGVRNIRGDLPAKFPGALNRGERVTMRYLPDMGAPNYRDELDRALGLALIHRHCLAWLDEVGDLTDAHNTPPFMRRALYMGRHRDLSLLMCGPRAMDINPQVISQADLVYVFDMPHPHDRNRVAEVIGYPPKDFDAAVHALGTHEYLRWDGDELVHFPPIPANATLQREQRFATP